MLNTTVELQPYRESLKGAAMPKQQGYRVAFVLREAFPPSL